MFEEILSSADRDTVALNAARAIMAITAENPTQRCALIQLCVRKAIDGFALPLADVRSQHGAGEGERSAPGRDMAGV